MITWLWSSIRNSGSFDSVMPSNFHYYGWFPLFPQVIRSILYFLLSCLGDCPDLVQLWIWLRDGFVEGKIGFLDCCLPCFFLMASTATCLVFWPLTVGCFSLTLSHWQAKSIAFFRAKLMAFFSIRLGSNCTGICPQWSAVVGTNHHPEKTATAQINSHYYKLTDQY